MLNIVCINSGNYCGQGRKYVDYLHDMVRRNLPAGMEGRFICFTDEERHGFNDGIEVRPLPVPGLKGWWNKLALFKLGVFEDGDRIVYFDLDTLITGRLDDIVAYNGPFTILEDAYRRDGLQSAVMAWEANNATSRMIWEKWEYAGYPTHSVGGDQAVIEKALDGIYVFTLQMMFPDLFVSYKASHGTIPAKASVVFFHGSPRPHDVTTGWVPDVWKIGGLMRAQLDTICNTAMETIHENVRINSARDLPWLDYVPAHDGHAVIVGGGPSAAQFTDEIAWRQTIGQTVIALNGSLRWLIDRGLAPDKFVMVDARQENVRKLAGCPFGIHHLLASQCDPDVFSLMSERKVTLWHSNAPGAADHLPDNGKPAHMIGGGSTVGLSTMVLAYVLGYRKIHLYGYDSSVSNDQHHAYDQPQNDGDIIVDVDAGGRRFRAAPWMVQQAQEFVELARWLAEEDCVITVHGDGLLPHLAHEMAKNPVTPAQQRAEAVLARLPAGRPVAGAEIGVFTGKMSRCLLQREDLLLTMVDSWKGNGESYWDERYDFHATLTQEQQDAYYAKAKDAVKFAGPRYLIMRKESVEAASYMADASLDFVFIDADHSYEGVKFDIEAWLPKLKPGGLLCGHDYANPDFPQFGVTRAVDEFCSTSGLSLDLGENLTWFVRLPASDRISQAA